MIVVVSCVALVALAAVAALSVILALRAAERADTRSLEARREADRHLAHREAQWDAERRALLAAADRPVHVVPPSAKREPGGKRPGNTEADEIDARHDAIRAAVQHIDRVASEEGVAT